MVAILLYLLLDDRRARREDQKAAREDQTQTRIVLQALVSNVSEQNNLLQRQGSHLQFMTYVLSNHLGIDVAKLQKEVASA